MHSPLNSWDLKKQVVTAPLIDLLTDPATASLSNREIARRTGVDHHFVAGFRAGLAAKVEPSANGGLEPNGVGPTPCAISGSAGARWQNTLSRPGHTLPCEPPALNSFDCWARATQAEKQKFVDAVGLHHLLAAAPIDHREAFLRQVKAPSEPPVANAWDRRATGSEVANLEIPHFLRRAPQEAPQ
jgi:hypothetical protein